MPWSCPPAASSPWSCPAALCECECGSVALRTSAGTVSAWASSVGRGERQCPQRECARRGERGHGEQGGGEPETGADGVGEPDHLLLLETVDERDASDPAGEPGAVLCRRWRRRPPVAATAATRRQGPTRLGRWRWRRTAPPTARDRCANRRRLRARNRHRWTPPQPQRAPVVAVSLLVLSPHPMILPPYFEGVA